MFSVNFICVFAILGELCWLEFFKTIYLETSDVQFGWFFENPDTNNFISYIKCLHFNVLNDAAEFDQRLLLTMLHEKFNHDRLPFSNYRQLRT